MKKLATVFALMVVLFAAPAWAGNWYMGVGLDSAEIGDEMGRGVGDGTGFAFDFGYRFSPVFALDFLWGMSPHSDDAVVWGPFVGDDFWYSHFDVGGNFILNPFGGVQPYLSFGMANHLIEYDTFPIEVSGTSLFFGGGIDFYLARNASIDVGVRRHVWNGDWVESGFFLGTIDATSSMFNVLYTYHFLY